MGDIDERVNDLDEARYRDNKRYEEILEEIACWRAAVEKRLKAHSDRLDSQELGMAERFGEIKTMLATQGVQLKVALTALGVIGVAVVGNVVALWFQ